MTATERGRSDIISSKDMYFKGALMDILTDRRNGVLRKQQEEKSISTLCICPTVVHELWEKRKTFKRSSG